MSLRPRESLALRCAPWVNLVLPGAGLVLAGRIPLGLMHGLVFAASANLALVAVLLFPDDLPRWAAALGVGFTAGAYAGGQLRLAHALRSQRAAAVAAGRRRALWEIRRLMEQGEYGPALDVLAPLARELPDDLLVAYRLAQVLTAAGTTHAAAAAWGRVRALDRHGVYRSQLRAWERGEPVWSGRAATDVDNEGGPH